MIATLTLTTLALILWVALAGLQLQNTEHINAMKGKN